MDSICGYIDTIGKTRVYELVTENGFAETVAYNVGDMMYPDIPCFPPLCIVRIEVVLVYHINMRSLNIVTFGSVVHLWKPQWGNKY